MTDKFTIEELMIRIMPGGFLLAIIYFIFEKNIQLNLNANLDFFYTFLFFCSAFIVGEILQTLAHEAEGIIDIFFKFRRPSEVFLYKGNPVLKNEFKRDEILTKLNLTEEKHKIFDKQYDELSILWWKKKKTEDDLSQSIFWRLYSQISDTDEIKIFNRNYLFIRVMIIEFLLLSILSFLVKNINFGIINIVVTVLFFWRGRGVARGLVFKTILLNLKEKI